MKFLVTGGAGFIGSNIQKGLSPQLANQLETKGTDPKAPHEVFNVACGNDQSILDLVDTLNKIIGKSIKPKFLPPRPGDVFRTLADISKAKELLGYKPEFDFEEGLRKTVEYFEISQLTNMLIKVV